MHVFMGYAQGLGIFLLANNGLNLNLHETEKGDPTKHLSVLNPDPKI